MSQGASAYPVSLLLDRIITEAGCSRYEFIQALGYRDVYRGLRRLDALEKGEGHPRIIKQIAAAYPAIAQDLKLAIAATSVIKKAETEAAWLGWCKAQQESFTPYIHIEGETTIPRGITLFGVSGGKWNLIELPQSDACVQTAVQRAVSILWRADGFQVCALPGPFSVRQGRQLHRVRSEDVSPWCGPRGA